MLREHSPEGMALRLHDGRLLAYQVYGLPSGSPIVFFHGFPGTHLQAAMVHAQAAALGVALVAFDRPGFGDSQPSPARTVDAVVGDVADLMDHLGHRRFGVIGVSCGGPYALATARSMPARVTAVGLLAGVGPMNRPEARAGQLPALTAMFDLARWHPWLASPLLALDWMMFRSDAQRAVKVLSSMLTPPDRKLLAQDPSTRALFGASLAAAYRQGIGGALREVQRITRCRADMLQGIHMPVHVFQSGQDRHVPPAMGRWIADALPHGRLHLCPDEGHLSIVVRRFDDCARLVLGGA